MHGLSKSRLLAWRQCPKRLWLQVRQPELARYATPQAARLAAGTQVGEVARDLWHGGRLIDDEDLSKALATTKAALNFPAPVFEATFQHDGVLIRADLLLPGDGGYRLAEVKSSTQVKDYHLADAAIQAWVTRQAGVTLDRIEIAHIDKRFVYPGNKDYQGLFKYVDVSADIAFLEQEVPTWISGARATLASTCPESISGEHCHVPFDCPFLNHCAPADKSAAAYPVEILPWGSSVAARLRAEGYVDLRDVPAGKLKHPRHLRVWRATQSGQAELLPGAAKQISALGFPRCYVDFETIQFAVPLWAGTRPYAQIPFQWSCHVETADGELAHASFLAEEADDPRRAFAESLLAVLGIQGPVIVYNAAFERSRLQELARDFPDIAPALAAVIQRIFDLLPVARENYYHPAMRGSWSIKAVLPTLAPDLDYSDLEVGNGGRAQEAFAEILHPETMPERRLALRQALLQYCERDTLAMVRIARYFGEH